MFLSQHASSCRLMIRGDDLAKSMSRYLIDELANQPHVEIITESEIVELRGEQSRTAVVVDDKRAGERTSWTSRRCSCSSAPIRGPTGCGTTWRWTSMASCSPGAICARTSWARTAASARFSGDQPTGHLRRGRRALGLDQARRLRGRRRLHGRPADPPAAGGRGHARTRGADLIPAVGLACITRQSRRRLGGLAVWGTHAMHGAASLAGARGFDALCTLSTERGGMPGAASPPAPRVRRSRRARSSPRWP